MTKTKIISQPHNLQKFRFLFGDTMVSRFVHQEKGGVSRILNAFRKRKKYFRYSFTSCL